jgi:hypothetical protein
MATSFDKENGIDEQRAPSNLGSVGEALIEHSSSRQQEAENHNNCSRQGAQHQAERRDAF